MAALKLTKEAVDRLPIPENGQALHWDSEIKGFGALVSPGGTKSWIVQYRTAGRQSGRMVIGRCNRLAAEKARKRARQLLAGVDLGQDPAQADGLRALVENTSGTTAWNGPYLQRSDAILDPWGRPYHYRLPGQHGEFDIFTLGADGAPGGEIPGEYLSIRLDCPERVIT